MRLRIRNVINDPAFEAKREAGASKGNHAMARPSILGLTLVPGGIRICAADSIDQPTAVFLDSLQDSGSVNIIEIGVGEVDSVVSLLGFEAEKPPEPVKSKLQEKIRARTESGKFIADDPSTPDVDEAWVTPEPEEVLEEAPVEVEEEIVPAPEPAYTKTGLMKKRNSDLKSIINELDSTVDVSGKTKKQLVNIILELS